MSDALNARSLASDLREADYNRLKAVLAQTTNNVDLTSRSVAELRRVVRKKEAKPVDLAEFDSAYQQVRVREVALRNSILAASSAPPEIAAAAQAQVAADYEAYARAVTVAEATARVTRGALASNSRVRP